MGAIAASYIKFIINEFHVSFDNDLEYLYVGYKHLSDGETKQFQIERKDWLNAAELLLKHAIEFEEYEMCSEINEIIKKIKEGY